MSSGWWVRLKALFRREEVEAEFDEELRYHFDLEVERNIARGSTHEEARRLARRAVGDSTRLKEEARDTWRWRWLDELLQDVRYAARALRKSPGFTMVAMLSLGFGIGVTATVFSVIDALDFRPLPFANADRLVWVTEVSPEKVDGCPTCSEYGTGLRASADWQKRTHSFDAFGFEGQSRRPVVIREGDVVEDPFVYAASPGFFGLLGVRPFLGRAFVADDTLPGAEPVVLLDHQYWEMRFGGDRNIVGKRISYFKDLAGTDPGTLTVVGVLPEGFHFARTSSLWRPYSSEEGGGRSPIIANVARLKRGVTLAAAAAELRAIGNGLSRENPDLYRDWRFQVRPFRDLVGRSEGGGRKTLFGIALLVLLIAVLNVAGLFLARAASRRGELSVRSALGASRMRLVRQLLVEGITLGLVGGVCGVALSSVGVRAARVWFGMEQADLPPQVDHRVLAFIFGLSLLVGILTAVLPTLRSVRADLAGGIRERLGSTGGVAPARSARPLLAAQIACALVLVTGAAFLGSDFLKVRFLDLGFDPRGLQEVFLYPGAEYQASPETWRPMAEQARDRIGATPGVVGAALADILDGEVRTDRGLDASAEPHDYPEIKAVDRRYFETLRIRILAGRGFTSADRMGAAPVAIVNAAGAARFWPGESAIGHHVFLGDSTGSGSWLTVVGVTADAEMLRRVQRHVPEVYRPLPQVPLGSAGGLLYVRLAPGRPNALAAAQATAREALGRPVFWDSVEDFFSVILATQRHNAIALNLFAAFALLLAAMGVYGSVAYVVTSRTREIGIRLALGARRHGVLLLMARHAASLTVVGVLLGLGGALALTRGLHAFTWVGGALDPWVFEASASLIMLVVALATWLPARRATRVDPVIALKSE